MGQKTTLTSTELKHLASTVLGSEDKALAWFAEPRAEFGGVCAAELLDTDIGCGLVVMALNRLENEVVASSIHT